MFAGVLLAESGGKNRRIVLSDSCIRQGRGKQRPCINALH